MLGKWEHLAFVGGPEVPLETSNQILCCELFFTKTFLRKLENQKMYQFLSYYRPLERSSQA